jgi:sugar phosphate isomerase/epimerase
MGEIGRLAEAAGVYLCVENLPSTYGAQQVTMALLRQGGLEGVYVTIDPNHAWIDNPDPQGLVSELAPLVRATHFSDTLGHHDSHLIPGEGIVDYGHVATELARSGFGPARGDVVDLECSVWMQRKRARRGDPHPGDPGYEADGGRPSPERVPWHRHVPMPTSEYLMVAHYEATRIGELIEAQQIAGVR